MIKEYIEDICEELNISVPEVSFDTSNFRTKTMMAYCDGKTIFIKPSDKPNPDQLFAIAHELRHLWQLQEDEDYYFHSYKTADEIDNESYNLQIAEVDANAFASVIMNDWFGLQPLYNGLSNKVVSAIKDRIVYFILSN